MRSAIFQEAGDNFLIVCHAIAVLGLTNHEVSLIKIQWLLRSLQYEGIPADDISAVLRQLTDNGALLTNDHHFFAIDNIKWLHNAIFAADKKD